MKMLIVGEGLDPPVFENGILAINYSNETEPFHYNIKQFEF